VRVDFKYCWYWDVRGGGDGGDVGGCGRKLAFA